MKKVKLALTLIPLILVSCSHNPSVKYDITLESLLDEMVNRSALTEYPSIPYKPAQVSSYDRRSVAPDKPGWWANDDGAGYERLDTINGRIEKVMCELQGAGAVTRIWMTTREKYGNIRIYLDGEQEAGILIPAYDMARFPITVPDGLSLTHTHYDKSMGGVGGNSFFLPIPFSKSCRITFEEPDMNVKIPRYYHIGYRLYPEGTKVKTFSLKDAQAAESLMEKVSEELLHPAAIAFDSRREESAVLNSGESLELELPSSCNKVVRLIAETQTAEAFRIEGIFDDIRTVEAPLAHFAGAGEGAPDVDGYWLSNTEGRVICRYPMPYRHSGRIKLTNLSDKTVSIRLTAEIAAYEWKRNSLYFHTSFRHEDGIPVSPDYDSDSNLDWNFTTINGRGVYVGDLLSLNNHAVDWYGEGDEKIYIDSEVIPSFIGTGTEDYYNCSWAPVVPFLTPYGGAPRADEESSHGWNAFLRTRNLDVIPFGSSFKFDLEMLSWHHGTVDYSATAFWYGDAGNSVK